MISAADKIIDNGLTPYLNAGDLHIWYMLDPDGFPLCNEGLTKQEVLEMYEARNVEYDEDLLSEYDEGKVLEEYEELILSETAEFYNDFGIYGGG